MSTLSTTIATLLVLIGTAGTMAPAPGTLTAPADEPRQERATKRVIGAVETVRIKEAGLQIRGRVDTGAATCSIHAEQIEVAGDAEDRDAIGETIAFTLIGEDDQRRRINAEIADVRTVRTSTGTSRRYYVYLTIVLDDHEKRVLVNLHDRSRMSHPLLLGRNWLRGDYVVDVEK